MWLLLSAAPGAEVLDRVLAVVAGDLILMSDVRAARDFGFITAGGADPDGQALARLIDRALILAEVERFAPPEPEAAAVDKGLALVRERFRRKLLLRQRSRRRASRSVISASTSARISG
jgi:hypothetical protein